jgi:hypothetical protein
VEKVVPAGAEAPTLEPPDHLCTPELLSAQTHMIEHTSGVLKQVNFLAFI